MCVCVSVRVDGVEVCACVSVEGIELCVCVSVSVEGIELCVCLLLYFLHNIILMYPHVATYTHFLLIRKYCTWEDAVCMYDVMIYL